VTVSFAEPLSDAHGSPKRHTREFIKLAVEARTDFYTEVQQFLEARLSEIKKRTEESEGALNDFRRRNRVLPVGGSEKEKRHASSACPA